MKKNKNLLKGMTLVEVLVAMMVFFLMFTTIIGVLSVSLKYINQSRHRDLRTSEQAMVVGEKIASNTDLQEVNGDVYTVEFQNGGSSITSDHIAYYQVVGDATRLGDEFRFQLKTFGKATSFLGLNTRVSVNPSDNEYLCQITNNYTEPMTMYVTISDTANGVIFRGASDSGYYHSSKLYTKTIPIGETVDFGYKIPTGEVFNSGDLQIKFVGTVTGTQYGPFGLSSASFDSTTRTYTYP